jgi:hypothetical protein
MDIECLIVCVTQIFFMICVHNSKKKRASTGKRSSCMLFFLRDSEREREREREMFLWDVCDGKGEKKKKPSGDDFS